MVGANHPVGDIHLTAPFDLAARTLPGAVGVNQQRQQHLRVIRPTPRPLTPVASMQRRHVQLRHDINHEPGQMPLRQPIAHIRRQQKLLITIAARAVTSTNALRRTEVPTRSSTTRAQPPSLVDRQPGPLDLLDRQCAVLARAMSRRRSMFRPFAYLYLDALTGRRSPPGSPARNIVLCQACEGDRHPEALTQTPIGSGHVLEVDGSSARTARCAPSTGCRSPSAPGVVTGFLGPTAPARRRRCGRSSGSPRSTPARCAGRAAPSTPTPAGASATSPRSAGCTRRCASPTSCATSASCAASTRRRRPTGGATAWLERLGLADRVASNLEDLSLGNQQRIQLISALVHEPDVLILDEPFSGLDPIAVDALSKILVSEARRGATVLFSSHQLDLVEHLCEDAVIVDRGRAVAQGPLDELDRRPRPGARDRRAGATGRDVDRRASTPPASRCSAAPTAPSG